MQAEFNIDHLSTYATEPADPQRHVPNPERSRLEKALLFLTLIRVSPALLDNAVPPVERRLG